MTWADFEQALLPLALWREGRGEGVTGMRAIGHVILNRMVVWEKSLARVITDLNQFSAMTVLGDAQTVKYPLITDKAFAAALNIAGELLRGVSQDPTGGAVFYRNPKTANSAWFQKEVAESGRYVLSAVIGNHEFWAPKQVEPNRETVHPA